MCVARQETTPDNATMTDAYVMLKRGCSGCAHAYGLDSIRITAVCRRTPACMLLVVVAGPQRMWEGWRAAHQHVAVVGIHLCGILCRLILELQARHQILEHRRITSVPDDIADCRMHFPHALVRQSATQCNGGRRGFASFV